MACRVIIKKKVLKNLSKMPLPVQRKLKMLIHDLELHGLFQPTWPNYGKLSPEEHHCHLGYKWVACWRPRHGDVEIEVYYAGSREDAPY